MRLNILLFFSVLVSLGLYWTVTRRKREEEQLLKRNKFQFIKLSVSAEVLGEYKVEISKKQPLMAKIKEEVKALESEAADHLAKQTANKAEVEACENAKKQITDEAASLESELGSKKEEFTKQKANWEAEVASLNKQINEKSKLCDFIKTDSEVARKLCGVPDPKPDAVKDPKPEEAKAEAPKAEAPKPEEAKAEAPKPEEAKAEAPKPEEAKEEASKPEEAKAEAPKPEEAKAEAPKPEEAKAEAPKS
ncbi:neurofilament heavy polypeptide isoform X2 [Gadus macrocephalus]|uniref:neurofilament heavy polypeptide isoform X2 n=1 Tax=Gadus macrocephalus TaxID=80720 RepID=UPI0028CBA9D3|nr:neurofilament heavy polypeptide isoform X2 [Gadus macrocephalus]